MSVREREQQLVQDRGALHVLVQYRQRSEQGQREDPFVVAGQGGEAIGGLLVDGPGRSFVAELQMEICKLSAERVPRDPLGGMFDELEGFARTPCSDRMK